MTAIVRLSLLAGLLLMPACAGPAPRIYVLAPPVAPVSGMTSDAGRPIVELKTVTVPDYLDTLEIQTRDGQNALKVSTTGRWGERLSVGVTRALEEALTRRLPRIVIARSVPSGQAARTLLITVDAFDVLPDGRCVLTARWSVLGADRHGLEASDSASVVTMVPGASDGLKDADVVAAMASAVDRLADRVAATLSRTR
jgi:uncharacterized lipoprotein YmbA